MKNHQSAHQMQHIECRVCDEMLQRHKGRGGHTVPTDKTEAKQPGATDRNPLGTKGVERSPGDNNEPSL